MSLDRRAGIGEAHSVREARDELLNGIERWRATLDVAYEGPSTRRLGIALRAVLLAGAILRIAVSELAPEVPLAPKPTLGDLVSAVEQGAAKQRATCLGTRRRLLRPTEIQVLHRLSRMRASLVHQEELAHLRDASEIGRLGDADVAEFLDVAQQLCRLPLVDELVCREDEARGAS